MLRLKHSLEPGRAVFGELIEPCAANLSLRQTRGLSITNESLAESDLAGRPSSQHGRIDEVVVTYFARPHSYTTDDIIEISAHGSPVVLGHIVELALRAGARLAQPGEFTMRAFLNGRIDLTQAEAVRDLIDSQTLYQAKVAAQQLEGALSRRRGSADGRVRGRRAQPARARRATARGLRAVRVVAAREPSVPPRVTRGLKELPARRAAPRRPLPRMRATEDRRARSP